MILIADTLTEQTATGEITEYGKIQGKEKVTPNEFQIAGNAEIIMTYASPGQTTGSRGNESNNFCCANHIHPYSDNWKNDVDFQNLKNTFETARQKIEESQAIKGYNFLKKLSQDASAFSAIIVALIAGSAPFLASFAVLMIKIIELMTGLNIDFEIDIDGVMKNAEQILDILKNIYG